MKKTYHLCINGICASEYSCGEIKCVFNSWEELQLEKLTAKSLFPNVELTQFVVYGASCIGLVAFETA